MSTSPSAAPLSNRVRISIAAGLFAFAFLLRLFGIGWGLPDEMHHQSFHPDEYFIWQRSQAVEPAQLVVLRERVGALVALLAEGGVLLAEALVLGLEGARVRDRGGEAREESFVAQSGTGIGR